MFRYRNVFASPVAPLDAAARKVAALQPDEAEELRDSYMDGQ
jgi:hypothetical protein